MRPSVAASRPLAMLVVAVLTLASLVTGTANAAAALVSPPSRFTGIQPTRFLDTVRGVGAPVGPVGANTTITASAAALAPEGATALVVNLWARARRPTAR